MRSPILNFKFQVSDWCSIKGVTILFAVLCFLNPATAQEIKVNAKFNADSVKIGKPIEFNLSVHYPQKMNVLFPDSTFSYKPFELQKKKYYTTQTKNGISVDSATYILATYEIDSIQSLSLPVFVVNVMDCTQVFSNTDSVRFHDLVKSIPDSLTTEKLPLKVNVSYLGVSWQLNYILVGIIVGVLIIAMIVLWIIFGKRIKRYFRLKKLAKGYELFRSQYEKSLAELEHEFSPQQAEQSLVIWKKYLELLLSKPYTKYTSREIRIAENSEELGQSLSTIDRMIYGHQHENVISPFTNLKEYVQQQFEKKKSEVANG